MIGVCSSRSMRARENARELSCGLVQLVNVDADLYRERGMNGLFHRTVSK